MTATLFEQFEQDVALLDTVFAEAPVGLAFFDTDLRYVRVNDALAEINGIAPEAHVGRSLLEVLPELDPEVLPGLRRVLVAGAPMKDIEVVGRTPSRPGIDRTWLCGYYPVRQRAGGQILGIGAIIVEVTERVQAA